MKGFDEVESPNVKQPKPHAVDLDSFQHVWIKEKIRKDAIICRILPVIVVLHPELLDTTPTLRRNEEIAKVYKKINESIDK